MSDVANAAGSWNAETVKAGCVNSRPTGIVIAATTARSWITFALNVWSKNGCTLPKLQAPHGRGHVNFRTSLPGRRRSNDRSAVL
jgi:hypothetical protein